MKKLFKVFDVPLIRTSKNREVIVTEVGERNLYLVVDDEIVIVTRTEKGLRFSCSCRWCSVKGIPNSVTNCGRIIRVIWFLIQHNGRVSEIQCQQQ